MDGFACIVSNARGNATLDHSYISISISTSLPNPSPYVRIYDSYSNGDINAITQVYECKESRQWISDIKFSPDGRILCVGAHDNSLYIYSATSSFKRVTKFSKHNSFITHFDFSKDGHYIMSNCGAYELLFSEVPHRTLTRILLSPFILGAVTCDASLELNTNDLPHSSPLSRSLPLSLSRTHTHTPSSYVCIDGHWRALYAAIQASRCGMGKHDVRFVSQHARCMAKGHGRY